MTLTLTPRQAQLVAGALIAAPIQGTVAQRTAIRSDLDLIDQILAQIEEGLKPDGTPQNPH